MKSFGQTIGYKVPRLLLFIIGLCQFLSGVSADSILQTHRVLDHGYGQALYEHFQQNHLNAITTLLVADRQLQPARQKNESDLLLADLYYRYGLHNESA